MIEKVSGRDSSGAGSGDGGSSSGRRLAVLIDADNAPASVIDALLAEVARFGVASVKRIYGDWTSPNMSQWKKRLLDHSITPVQQFAYTTGKNATDSAMIIDAMDLMYTHRFSGFCLVSSDSDFTGLARRLREQGLTVYGFGERKTPQPFVQACDRFVYTEVLGRALAGRDGKSGDAPAESSATGRESDAKTEVADLAESEFPAKLIDQAIDEASDDSGWAHLGAVGNFLQQLRSDFDPRLYGHKKLSDLIRSRDRDYEVQKRGPGQVHYVRSRRNNESVNAQGSR